MQREKLATIGLVVIIAVVLCGFLVLEYWDELSEPPAEAKVEAIDDSFTYFQNSSQNFVFAVLNDVYTNISTVQFEIVTQPSNGVAEVIGQSIYYTPTKGYLDSDSFTYKLIDETGKTSQANVDINLEIGTVELGDCVDVHYIGTFEDGSLFGYSYEDPIDKTGGILLNIFMSTDDAESPPEGYEVYSNLVANQYYVEDFINGLEGLNIGDTKRIGPISPDESFGVRPVVGDIIDLTAFDSGIFSIFEIEENVDMPEMYAEVFGNVTTTLYTLRDESHYIGEIIVKYTLWEDSSVVTNINDTLIWTYTTPTTNISENITWSETIIDEAVGTQFLYEYPINASQISSMDDDTILVTHNPEVGSTIQVSTYIPEWSQYMAYLTYTVEKLTDDKINVSYADPLSSEGAMAYTDLDRITTIERSETQNITQDALPGELLEVLVFSYLRSTDPEFTLGTSPFTETVYIDLEVVDIEYKNS